ncbi:ABC transporter substrate-binding protein [Pseudomonas aeruginosa]
MPMMCQDFQRASIRSILACPGAARGYAYFDVMGMGELIKSVEKVDEPVALLSSTVPEAPFLRDMAMPSSRPSIPPEYGDQLLAAGKQGQLNNQPIGTGPFVFKRYAKDAQVRYTANSDYYAGKPPIDNLVSAAITLDPNVRMQKVRAGECQVSLYPETGGRAEPEAGPELRRWTRSMPRWNSPYIAINTCYRRLDDPRVRQAINLALDKKAMSDAVRPRRGQSGGRSHPPTLLGYNHSIQDWPHDPRDPRQGVGFKEAGAENPGDHPVHSATAPRSTIPNPAPSTDAAGRLTRPASS